MILQLKYQHFYNGTNAATLVLKVVVYEQQYRRIVSLLGTKVFYGTISSKLWYVAPRRDVENEMRRDVENSIVAPQDSSDMGHDLYVNMYQIAVSFENEPSMPKKR